MRLITLFGCLCLMLSGATTMAWGAQALSDEEMDQVAAGTLSAEMVDGKLHFLFDNGSKMSIEGSGTVIPATASLPSGPAGYMVLRDNAQGNLHAFINTNAVNSNVQMLINLTVNINSTIGTLNQANGPGK